MKFLLFLLLPASLVKSIAASSSPEEHLFRESSDVGVSHCSMPGRFGDHHATLTVWLRAVVWMKTGMDSASRLEIKGFAFMESWMSPSWSLG